MPVAWASRHMKKIYICIVYIDLYILYIKSHLLVSQWPSKKFRAGGECPHFHKREQAGKCCPRTLTGEASGFPHLRLLEPWEWHVVLRRGGSLPWVIPKLPGMRLRWLMVGMRTRECALQFLNRVWPSALILLVNPAPKGWVPICTRPLKLDIFFLPRGKADVLYYADVSDGKEIDLQFKSRGCSGHFTFVACWISVSRRRMALSLARGGPVTGVGSGNRLHNFSLFSLTFFCFSAMKAVLHYTYFYTLSNYCIFVKWENQSIF